MATNAGKRLERLEKLLDSIATKNKQHHFVLVCEGETAQEKIDELARNNTIQDGDDLQTISIPWKPKRLKGSEHIPEGSADDPLADPLGKGEYEIGGIQGSQSSRYGYGSGIGANAPSQALDRLPTADHLARWKAHEQVIERAGERYKGDTRTS